MAPTPAGRPTAVCLSLTRAISSASTLGQIYDAALGALAQGLGVTRASILLFDPDGVMRFKASRRLSEAYRQAVEGHTPWRPDTLNPQPIVVGDVTREPSLAPYLPTIAAEGIAAMAFIPLVSLDRVIGKFMLYFDAPRTLTGDELELVGVIAAQVAFAVTRARAEEKAEAASRLKDEFLGTLSHELRTPLNAIVGWVQVLQQGDMTSPERVRHAIDVIGRNARLQTQLIEDILDVTRIVAGKLEVERRPILIPKIVDAVLTDLLPAIEAKQIALSRAVAADLPPIEGDLKRLHQVLGNIVSNAVKFTPQGGEIAVFCDVDDRSIVIRVRDSGAGIAPDFLPFVFERFRQADSRSARRHGGLGLGLAIARHLIELHGGDIQVESDGPGRGSTFSVRLPIVIGASAHIVGPSVATVDQVRLDGLTVLVVDDDADSREVLAALLGRCGAHVRECESTASAIVALDSAPVSLMVADLGMPDVDGYGLIKYVRQMGNGYRRIPAVAVTAYARPEDRHQALTSGYDGFCPKPVEATGFLRAVQDVLRSDRS